MNSGRQYVVKDNPKWKESENIEKDIRPRPAPTNPSFLCTRIHGEAIGSEGKKAQITEIGNQIKNRRYGTIQSHSKMGPEALIYPSFPEPHAIVCDRL